MRDYVNVKPKKQVQPETIWESIATGLVAIACAVMMILFALFLTI